MKLLFCVLLAMSGALAFAEDEMDLSGSTSGTIGGDVDRDPAAIKVYSGKRTYPGGADEEDLQVQAKIPEAMLKTDSRSVQREVYKDLYNQEMKEERQETVEE